MQQSCPEQEVLAAYIDGSLTLDERKVVDSHLVKCSRCRKIVSLAVKAEAQPPVTPPPDEKRDE